MLRFVIPIAQLIVAILLISKCAEADAETNTTGNTTTSGSVNGTDSNGIKSPDEDEIERHFEMSDCNNTDISQRPNEYKACSIFSEFLNWNLSAISQEQDWNWERTKQDIQFLQTFAFEEAQVDKTAVWKHRMNMHRFRRYMKSVGFMKNPGSIIFRTHQEKTTKLFCGLEKDKNSKKGETGILWTAMKWNDRFVLDNDWNKNPGDTRYNVFKAAHSYEYITRYRCKEKKGQNRHHFFYVITRPYPQVNEHIQIYEGSSGSLTCEVRKCLYDDGAEGCTDHTPGHPPLFYPPVEFYFVFPNFPKIEVRDTSDIDSLMLKGKKAFPDTSVTFKPESDKRKKSSFVVHRRGESATTVLYWREAHIVFSKALKEYHDGKYECVFVDYNGVSSTTQGEINAVKLDGVRHVHVRKMWWLYIAIGILCAVPVFSIFIECFLPHRLEHDDGTVYTKAELEFSEKAKLGDDKETKAAQADMADDNEVLEININPGVGKPKPTQSSATVLTELVGR